MNHDRPRRKTIVSAALLSIGMLGLVGESNHAGAQAMSASTAMPRTPTAPSGPSPARATAEAATGKGAPGVAPVAYWGAAAPAPPRRKPTAVRRLWNRVGTFLGADEEPGTTPMYRDPTTGRTTPASMKPWMPSRPK